MLRSCDALIGLIIVGIPLACLILLGIGLLIYFAPVIIGFLWMVVKYIFMGIAVLTVTWALIAGTCGAIRAYRSTD